MNVNTPLQPANFPSGRWEKGAIDIVGPIGNKYLITFIDYYSSFPEVVITRDISSAKTVRVLKDIFARFGLLEEILSDNGPQFVSKEFETFLNKNIFGMCAVHPIILRVMVKLKDSIVI